MANPTETTKLLAQMAAAILGGFAASGPTTVKDLDRPECNEVVDGYVRFSVELAVRILEKVEGR